MANNTRIDEHVRQAVAAQVGVRWPEQVAGGRLIPRVSPAQALAGDELGQALQEEGEIEAAMRTWWMAHAAADVERALRGLREYSSSDLAIMGDAMRQVGAVPNRALFRDDTRFGVLSSIGFYVLGKVARWLGSLGQGTMVSQDTLLDVVVYTMMARFVQEHGEWSQAAVARMINLGSQQKDTEVDHG